VTLTEELQLVRNKQPKRWTSVQQFSDVANRQVGRVEEEIILPSRPARYATEKKEFQRLIAELKH
jgi:hypothetical protein